MVRKTRRENETPKFQHQRKTRPKDTAPADVAKMIAALNPKQLAKIRDAFGAIQSIEEAPAAKPAPPVQVFDPLKNDRNKFAPRGKVFDPLKRNRNKLELTPRKAPNARSRDRLLFELEEHGITRRTLEQAAAEFDQGVDEPHTRLAHAVVEYFDAAGQRTETVRWCAIPNYVWDARTAEGRALEAAGWAGHSRAYTKRERIHAEENAAEMQQEAMAKLAALLCGGDSSDEYLL